MKWTFSGAKTFLRCPRSWTFGLIANANAKDPLRHEAHILRQLTTPLGWLGNLVHSSIVQWGIPEIRQEGNMQADAIIEKTIALAERQEAFSRAHRYRTVSKSRSNGNFLALDLHERGEDLSSVEKETIRARIKYAFENLTKINEVTGLIHRSRTLWTERRFVWKFNGNQIEVKPDLLLIDNSGRPILIDWKVRDTDTPTAILQLGTYGLIITESGSIGKIRSEFFRLLEVNLLKGYLIEHQATKEMFDRADDYIFRTLDGMHRTLGELTINEINPWMVETTQYATRCIKCQFRSLCGKGEYYERRNIQPRLL